MRRAKAKLTVSTFPFLAVLLCAMGSLIMLLMVFDQRAKRAARERNLQHAVEVAKQEEERWKNAQALMARKTAEEEADRAEQIRKLRQEGESRLRELEKDAEKIQNSERDALAVRAAEEKKIEGLRQQTLAAEKDKEKNSEELARLKASLNQARRDQLDREAKRLRRKAEVEVAKKAIEAEAKAEKDRLDRLAMELGDLEKVLKQAEDKKERSAQTFSIIPYKGKRGDDKRPIYVECTWNKLIFHPDKFVVDPGDPRMGLLTQIEERAKAQNRLYMEAGLSAHPRPFLMLLVRPDGIATYYQFQVAVKGQAIDFGYELIDQEWELDFPQDPPPKTNLANAPAGSAPFKNNPDGKNGGTGLNGFAGGQPGSPGGSAGGALSPGGGNALANGAGFSGGQPGSPGGPLGGPGGFGGPGGGPGQEGAPGGTGNGPGSVRGFRAGSGNGNGGGMAGLVTGPGGMPGGGNGTGNSPLPGNLAPGFGLGGGPGGVGAPGGPGGLGPIGGNGPGGFGPGTGTGLGGNGTGVGGPFPGGTGSLANGPGGTGLGGGNGPVPGVGGTSGTGGVSGPGQLALGGGNGSGNGTPGFPAGQGTGFGLGGGQGGTPGSGGAAGTGALALGGGNGGGSGQPGLPGGQGTGNGTGLGGGTGTGVPGLPNPDKTDGVMGNGAVPGVAMSPQRIPGPTAPALGATGLTKQGSFGGLPGPLPGVGGGEPGGEGGPGGSGNGSSGIGGAGGAGGSGPPGAGGTGRGDNGPGGIGGGQGSPDGGKPGTGPGGGGVAGEPGTPGGSSQGQPGGSAGASGQPGSLPPMDGPPAFPSVGSSGAAGGAGGGTPGLSVNLNPMDDQKPQEGARIPKPTGASGDGFPGNEDAAMDPLGRLNIPLPTVTENRPKPPRPLRPAKLTGGREMTHFVECTAEGVILHPGGKKFSKQAIIQPEVANPLLQELKEKVERRRTLDKAAGSTSYIQVRFLVWPDGMRAYHALYPAVSTWGVFSQQQTINNPQDLREALSRP